MLSVWQRNLVDRFGNVVPNASVEVRDTDTGELSEIYSDSEGNTPLDNPFTADASGFAKFYARGGLYNITVHAGGAPFTWDAVALGALSHKDEITADVITDDADELAAIRSKLGVAAAEDVLSKDNNLSDLSSALLARQNLGLGTAATYDVSDFDEAGSAALVADSLADLEGSLGELAVKDTVSEAIGDADAGNVNARLGVFNSAADVEGHNIPPVLDAIRTNGYYTPGDGGGALYKRVSTEPAHGGKIQSADGAWWELGEAVVNVLQFGAKRDAVPGLDTGTDDSAAFNAMTEYLRPLVYGGDPANGYRIGVGTIRIVIPPGYYLMENSWNLTDFRSARNITIEGHGAVLIGRTPGYPVVDALDSRWLHFHGLTVHGSIHAPPTCGIQIGKTGQITAVGNNGFDEVRCSGSFALAGFANFGCETTTHRRCRYSNIMPDDDANGIERFAYIGVGDFFLLPTSQYKSITATVGTNVSFTQNSFYACDFRNNADGSTMLLTGSSGHYFDKGCYYVAFNKANVVLDGSYSRNTGLSLYGHFENGGTSPVTGSVAVDYLIWWRGDGSNTTLDAFVLDTTTVHAEEALIYSTNIGTDSAMRGATLNINRFRSASPGVFFKGAPFHFSGDIFTNDDTRLNLRNLSSMNGSVLCADRNNVASWANGAYQVHDRTGGVLTIGDYNYAVPSPTGLSLAVKDEVFTPTITFEDPGDLDVIYSLQRGHYTLLPGNLVYVNLLLRFTPTFTTATGTFSIQGLPATSMHGGQYVSALAVSQLGSVQFPDGFVTAEVRPNSTHIFLRVNASGESTTLLDESHFLTGTEHVIGLSGIYKAQSIQ